MWKFVVVLGAVGFVSGCATTYPVVAVIDRTDERFLGTATSTVGTSHFQMTNADGVVCKGEYKAEVVYTYSQGASTTGQFSCSDGRTGNYTTAGTAVGGQGVGKFGGNRFRIYYGQFASYQQIQ